MIHRNLKGKMAIGPETRLWIEKELKNNSGN
jgi:hypothetical protein